MKSKFQKMILQTQNLGRTVNREGLEWGLRREKNLPPSNKGKEKKKKNTYDTKEIEFSPLMNTLNTDDYDT